ncbi:MAG: hypothetical protein J6U44_01565 [Paludibacteraceae bacterium]|nr:hypothetical protein [Paludibacteraceae bacterium]MBO7315841.1 hypothetical protein [Paludibacteraceae bacterium]
MYDCGYSEGEYFVTVCTQEREHYFGEIENGEMNSSSSDEQYMALIGALRQALKALAKKIEPKVYEYGFLK